MAVLDVIWFGPTSVNNNAYLDLVAPGGGISELIIHNVHVPTDKSVEFYAYDGTNEIKFDADATFAGRQGVQWHCTATKRYRVKNVSGGAILIAADGVVTKV